MQACNVPNEVQGITTTFPFQCTFIPYTAIPDNATIMTTESVLYHQSKQPGARWRGINWYNMNDNPVLWDIIAHLCPNMNGCKSKHATKGMDQ